MAIQLHEVEFETRTIGPLVLTVPVLRRLGCREIVNRHCPIAEQAELDLYSAYCRKGWGGCVRQNLPRGHANFHRRLFLTTLAIKRAEPFSRLHENRP